MAAQWQNQYRTVTDTETDHLNALGPRQILHWEEGVNSTVVACSPKLVSFVSPSHTNETDQATIERVSLVMGPFAVATCYDVLSVTIGHYRSSGTGAENVVWKLYSSPNLYDSATTLDADILGPVASSATIATTNSDTFAIATSVRNIKIARDGHSGWTWLTLTSTGSVSGVAARLVTLDVTAQKAATYA